MRTEQLLSQAAIENIDKVGMEDINLRLQSFLQEYIDTTQNSIKSLRGYANLLPEFDPKWKENLQSTYIKGKPRAVNFPLGSHDTAYVEYTTQTKTFWFRKDQVTGTLLLSSGKITEAFVFKIDGDAPITDEDVKHGANCIASFVANLQFTPGQEATLLRYITELTGTNQFSILYSKNRATQICEDYTMQVRKHLEQFEIEFKKLYSNFSEVDFTEFPALANFVSKTKSELRSKLEIIATEIEDALRATAKQQQEEQENKTRELEELIRLHKEKLERVIEKEQQLDAKLDNHRQEIDESFYQIAPAFLELFPDVIDGGYRRNPETFKTKVCASLRIFYSLKLRDDLRNNEYINVPTALKILQLLRKECIASNKNPRGEDVREIYSGFRAALDYITLHNVTIDTVLGLLEDAARRRTGAKTSVEAFVESALTYDFDMSKYTKDLHQDSFTDKKELKLK